MPESVAAGLLAWQHAFAAHGAAVVAFEYGAELVSVALQLPTGRQVRVDRGWRSTLKIDVMRERLRVTCTTCCLTLGDVVVIDEPPAATVAKILTDGVAKRCGCGSLRRSRDVVRAAARQPFLRGLERP